MTASEFIPLLISLATMLFVGYEKILSARAAAKNSNGVYLENMMSAANQLVDSYRLQVADLQARVSTLEQEVKKLHQENHELRQRLEQSRKRTGQN